MGAPRTGAERLNKYMSRVFDTEGMPDILLVQKAQIQAQETAHFNTQYSDEVAVRTILNAQGVQIIMFSRYQSFAKEIRKAMTRYAGPSLSYYAYSVCKAKWVAYGLIDAVLILILTDVFAIPAPGP